MGGYGVEGRGRKKCLKKSRDEERDSKKIRVVWSSKVIEGSICTINKRQGLICILLKIRG